MTPSQMQMARALRQKTQRPEKSWHVAIVREKFCNTFSVIYGLVVSKDAQVNVVHIADWTIFLVTGLKLSKHVPFVRIVTRTGSIFFHYLSLTSLLRKKKKCDCKTIELCHFADREPEVPKLALEYKGLCKCGGPKRPVVSLSLNDSLQTRSNCSHFCFLFHFQGNRRHFEICGRSYNLVTLLLVSRMAR